MSLRNKVVTVKRHEAGTRVFGDWIEGAASTFLIKCNIQAMSSHNMEFLPDGRRVEGDFVIYTDKVLILAEQGSETNADILFIYEKEYECVHIKKWQNNLINHYKYIVNRILSTQSEHSDY